MTMNIGEATRLVMESEFLPVDEELLPEAWQVLVDTGAINTMPGKYGRQAQGLLDQGLLEPPAGY